MVTIPTRNKSSRIARKGATTSEQSKRTEDDRVFEVEDVGSVELSEVSEADPASI
jgi:hypothetical protein